MTRMAEGEGSKEPETDDNVSATNGPSSPKKAKSPTTDDTENEEEEDEDEDEEEPRLKYASLTQNLTSLYRNGDASSAFLVVGDKMVGSPSKQVWRIGKHTYRRPSADCRYS